MNFIKLKKDCLICQHSDRNYQIQLSFRKEKQALQILMKLDFKWRNTKSSNKMVLIESPDIHGKTIFFI